MIVFIKLLLAHLLGDFVFQPNRWVIHKEVHKAASGYLYVHLLIHYALVMLLLWDPRFWLPALIIVGAHYLIDLAKIYAGPMFRNQATPFFIDQLLHVAVIYAVAFHGNLGAYSAALLRQVDWYLVTAVVFVSFPSAIIMSRLLERMSAQIELDHKSLPNAGKYIGMMERLFVFLFIIMGRWDAIGLLITAKSVFRFNDLKATNNRKLTEYILIGTFLSFGIAILTGLAYIMLKR
jgi:hypothetical protein